MFWLRLQACGIDKADENGLEGTTIYQGKVYVKLCLECGLEAMVAWSWSELAVYGIKDSPKKESEILIKMFNIYLIVHCFLVKHKWMENIVFLKSPRPSFYQQEVSISLIRHHFH